MELGAMLGARCARQCSDGGALSMVLRAVLGVGCSRHRSAQSVHMKLPPNIQYSIVFANRGTEHPVRTTMKRKRLRPRVRVLRRTWQPLGVGSQFAGTVI